MITPTKYRKLRQSIGTQTQVAEKLGISRSAIARRESGQFPITVEAWLALNVCAKPQIICRYMLKSADDL